MLNLSAGPLPPLAIIDPSGLRWVCEYGTRLFIHSLTLLRVLELLVPAVYNSQAGLLTLLKKRKKKYKKTAEGWQDMCVKQGRPLVTDCVTGRLI